MAQENDDFILLGYVDLDGLLRGKYVSREKFQSWQKSAGTFCSAVLGWDMRDELYDNAHSGWFNGFPDDPLRIAEGDGTRLANGRRFYLMEYADGKGAALCPRRLAARVLARGEAMGFQLKAGFEYEFYVFRETPESAKAKGFRNLTPFSPSGSCYSILRTATHEDFFSGMLLLAEQLGTPLEALHPEAFPGAMEFALTPAAGLQAADRAVIYKTFAKAWGQQQGLSLCFMAKPISGMSGCGGHTHISLWQGEHCAFFDKSAQDGLTQTARHYIGGLLRYMPELMALYAPTINSFTRLAPGFWAPTGANWGIDNRTCALRVLGDSGKSKRVEVRPPAADANPYLVLAAAHAAGLAGIEEQIEPPEPLAGNGYADTLQAERLFPRSLEEAAARLRGSEMARRWLGDAFVEHFAKSREAEVAAHRAAVSDWELERYFEII